MENFNKEYRIGELLFKQRVESLSLEEETELNAWLEKEGSNILLKERLLSDIDLEQQISKRKSIGTNAALQKVNQRINTTKTRRIIIKVAKYAAVIALPILAFWISKYTYKQSEIVQETIIEPGESKATLLLADGTSIDLDAVQNSSLKIGNNTIANNVNNELVYNRIEEGEVETNNIEKFNTLITPLKGEYSTTLSDGTKVWVNSSSSLRYPIRFVKNERKVYLSGEAYFEVAKNQNKPFYVILETGVEIKVLGTKFNVMAYDDEKLVEATLLEGKVQVTTDAASGRKVNSILNPNQQLSYNKQSKSGEVLEVDASSYVAWKDGLFILENERLDFFMRKLERWYGCKAVYETESLKEIKFTGEIRKYDEFSSVLKMLKLTEDIDFTIEGNVIHVRKVQK